MQEVAKLATVLPFRGQRLVRSIPVELICKGVHRDLDDLGRRALLSTALEWDVCDKEYESESSGGETVRHPKTDCRK